MHALHAAGARHFVELGPGTTLSALARTVLGVAECCFVPTVHGEAEEDDRSSGHWRLCTCAASRSTGRPRYDRPEHPVALPTYAFQRERHWVDTTQAQADRPVGPPPPALTPAGSGIFPADVPAAVPADISADSLVRRTAAAVLGHRDPAALDPELTFRDLGFDSLLVVELRDRLSAASGVDLPATVAFTHPTPSALARLLSEAGTPTQSPASADVPGPVPTAVADRRADRHPGHGLPVPRRRRGPGGPVAGGGPGAATPPRTSRDGPGLDRRRRASPRRGGFLDDAADFDAEFFGISPREALAMDPQQRVLLETAWEAVERAGLDPAALRGRRVGVFVGVTVQDYGPRLHEATGDQEGYVLTGTTPSVASGRISYTLGLQGPALTVDTACSSSLVAVHLAMRALRSGECDLALAGGAAVMAAPRHVHRVRPAGRPGRGRPLQGVRRRRGRHRLGRGRRDAAAGARRRRPARGPPPAGAAARLGRHLRTAPATG